MNEQIEMLYKKLDAQDAIIDQQALEISQLKEQKKQAIEWVHKHISKYNCKGITIIDWDELSNPNDLLQILGDKE